jgi:hypothetical protein
MGGGGAWAVTPPYFRKLIGKQVFTPPLLLKSSFFGHRNRKTRITPPLLWHLTYAPGYEMVITRQEGPADTNCTHPLLFCNLPLSII